MKTKRKVTSSGQTEASAELHPRTKPERGTLPARMRGVTRSGEGGERAVASFQGLFSTFRTAA